MFFPAKISLFALLASCSAYGQIKLVHTIEGEITPKSVVHNGSGLFFAQNMIYSHSVTVYNQKYELVKTISDRIKLTDYGHTGGTVKGGPVEAAFSHNGTIAWVSNYTMEGGTFKKPGCDNCSGKNYDAGFIYKINTNDFSIDKVIKVGAVPKFIAVSPDDNFVLVSNWTSGDVSVINTNTDEVETTVNIGRHPRGIVVDHRSNFAYITVMGSDKIARLSLKDFKVDYLPAVGRAPRHVCIDQNDRYLYCSINNLGKIVKIDLADQVIKGEVVTGKAPRSMEISPDGKYLYVVNYSSNTFSKVETEKMTELAEVRTKSHPIGITLNWPGKEVWVACYSGYIQIFRDDSIKEIVTAEPNLLAMSGESLFTLKTSLVKAEPPVQEAVSEEVVEVEEVDETEVETELTENNYLPNTYIVVGSFSVQSNATNLEKQLVGKGYDAVTLPSIKKGFTYTAIRVVSNPTAELVKIKDKVITSAWIYRP